MSISLLEENNPRTFAPMILHPPGCPCCSGSSVFSGGMTTSTAGGTSLTLGSDTQKHADAIAPSVAAYADSIGLHQNAQRGLVDNFMLFYGPEAGRAIDAVALLHLAHEPQATRDATVTKLNEEFQ